MLNDEGHENSENFELDTITAINLLLSPLPWKLNGPRLRNLYRLVTLTSNTAFRPLFEYPTLQNRKVT